MGQKGEEMKEMVKINVYAVIRGVTKIMLTIEVPKDEAQGQGTGFAAMFMKDKRVTDAWWDYEKVDNPSPDARE